MDILGVLTAELGVKMSQVEAAVKLIDEGNTIPFIARYRKEVTGSLNDEVLRNLDERLKYLRGLEDRKTQILASIEDQGKLTADLKRKIEEAETMVAVEDLYLPFRPKRKTRASMAKERGLEPLADTILLQVTKEPIETLAAQYVSEEKGVADAKAAIDGRKGYPCGAHLRGGKISCIHPQCDKRGRFYRLRGEGREDRVRLRDVLSSRGACKKVRWTQDSRLKPR